MDDNADFSSPLLVQSSLAVSEYTLTDVLPSGTYYWRVRAVDGAGNASGWTSVWSFVV